jgi:hypothetical protein
MKKLKAVLFLCAAVAVLGLPTPAQVHDVAGNLLVPPVGNDDPPGTKLKEILPAQNLRGVAMVGDRLYGVYSPNIYEVDPNSGVIKTTIPMTGTSGTYPFGLAVDLRRNLFVVAETSKMGIMLYDMMGTLQTFYSTSPDRNVGAAYDTYRDGYWIDSWNSNTLKLYDAKTFAVLRTISLSAVSCTRSAGAAYSPENDVVYTSSRDTKRGYAFAAATGTLIRSWPLVYTGTNNGQGAAWWDRWQCPAVMDYETKNLTWTDGGFPRVQANAKVKYGNNLSITWTAGSSPGKVYIAGASFTERVAGIPFGNRYFPMAADPLFFLSQVAPGVFASFQGVLDTNGVASGGVNVPGVPALAGLKFSIAWVTVDGAAPLGIEAISGPWQVEITN